MRLFSFVAVMTIVLSIICSTYIAIDKFKESSLACVVETKTEELVDDTTAQAYVIYRAILKIF